MRAPRLRGLRNAALLALGLLPAFALLPAVATAAGAGPPRGGKLREG
jgi:hypothetical protein